MDPAYKLLTVEEFLEAYPNDQRHYQLIDGIMVAMAAPGSPHQVIAANLTTEIVLAVRANRPGCTVRSQGGIAPQGVRGRNYFETDIAVTCEPMRSRSSIIEQPLLIVEILSPGTERDDRFIKLPAYQEIAGLAEIIYVETDEVRALLYRRGQSGWDMTELTGADAALELHSIGLQLPLGRIYMGVPGLEDSQ